MTLLNNSLDTSNSEYMPLPDSERKSFIVLVGADEFINFIQAQINDLGGENQYTPTQINFLEMMNEKLDYIRIRHQNVPEILDLCIESKHKVYVSTLETLMEYYNLGTNLDLENLTIDKESFYELVDSLYKVCIIDRLENISMYIVKKIRMEINTWVNHLKEDENYKDDASYKNYKKVCKDANMALIIANMSTLVSTIIEQEVDGYELLQTICSLDEYEHHFSVLSDNILDENADTITIYSEFASKYMAINETIKSNMIVSLTYDFLNQYAVIEQNS